MSGNLGTVRIIPTQNPCFKDLYTYPRIILLVDFVAASASLILPDAAKLNNSIEATIVAIPIFLMDFIIFFTFSTIQLLLS